ncbi:MAG: response regulator transcription factor [Alphaproteobacteria bacterium]|nr:response regulator transcription factor [Alphaproteobacteria bacterium]NCB49418.1 response regulator transcription factor [Alphaproteobacteria bacterium]
MGKKIFLVDDDRSILTTLTLLLEQEGYEVESFTEGFSFFSRFEKQKPDLILLDIKMPGMTGIEVLKKIRQSSAIPVVFVTSKEEESDEIQGFSLGADDYIKKPFSPTLLLARIQALFRRYEGQEERASLFEKKGLVLNKETQKCFWKNKEVDLTLTEFQIVLCLAERMGVVKTRENLIHASYGQETYVDDRTIDSHMKRIRHKFKCVDEDFNQIESLYGLGYRWK